MIQRLCFVFDGWSELLEWRHQQPIVVVFRPTAVDPDFWYTLELWGPDRYYIRSASAESSDVPVGRVLSSSELNRLRSRLFQPTRPGQWVVAADSSEVDWPACLAAVRRQCPELVRTWISLDGCVRLTRLGETTFGTRADRIGGLGLPLGREGILERLSDPDSFPIDSPDLREVRRLLLAFDGDDSGFCSVM